MNIILDCIIGIVSLMIVLMVLPIVALMIDDFWYAVLERFF